MHPGNLSTVIRGALIPAVGWACSGVAVASPNFGTEVRPVLQKCLPCHGPDEHSRMANLRLDSLAAASGQNGGYQGIVPGNSATSRVIARVSADENPMPPTGERLSAGEIETLRRWIDAGAKYERHWAFEPPARPKPPTVPDPDWIRNPIDSFVLARLDKEGLQPSPEADRHTLIRRLSLALTGLPPTPAEVEAFARDDSADAYSALVDRLLNSSGYGERWARVWLDLARYADSMGYEKDSIRTIWPYRDWVIQALNENIPFDRFTILQLAGDLLPEPTNDQLVATGFHRNTMTNTEGGTDDEEFRDAAVKDRVSTTGQVWMGLTWGCAQCHSHKYDPLSQKEFYSLYAFLNQTADADRNNDAPKIEITEGVSTLVLRELPTEERRDTFVHNRGNFMSPGEQVEPAVPAAFHPFPSSSPRDRLGLALWLTSKQNPLTARVTVNRLWSRLFGAGIVRTEEDFGTQGVAPTHPELLDWLATEFMRANWDVKDILKTIVTSATYRQRSDITPELLEVDPENSLLARGARFRMPAEMVRDQALFAAGLLSRKIGGEPVMPWQPEGIWQVVYSSKQWETSPGEDRYRRALYTLWRRTSPYPSMTTFDAPSGETCTIRRIRTNTPLQALVTLNDPTLMEAAQRLAARTGARAGTDPERRLDSLFQLVVSRPPSPAESGRLLALQAEAASELRQDSENASKLAHYNRVMYKANRRAPLVGDSRGDSPEWRYSAEDPRDGWARPGFDDSGWHRGKGAFGSTKRPNVSDGADPYGTSLRTDWNSNDLWARVEFDLADPSMQKVRLEGRFSGAFEAFVNGVPAAKEINGSGTFAPFELTARAKAALRPGQNLLAIHAVHNGLSDGLRFLDIGLTALRPPDFPDSGLEDADEAAWVVVANVVLNLDEALTIR